MRILICDDDYIAIEALRQSLAEFFTEKHLKCPEIAVFCDGESLLADTGEKDIVFLDIRMPGKDGIAVGNELKIRSPYAIVFITTAYAEYLDDAMRFQAFRYLTKPISRNRLFANLSDAMRLCASVSRKIAIETKSSVFSVPARDIVLIETQNRKVTVHTLTADYLSVRSINDWENLLPKNCFFRTHRSFLVNHAHVTDFNHDTVHLCGNRFSAYLARRSYTEFKAAYLLYLESVN